jgi:ABC-type transport system substrate-binding protein
VIRRIFIGFVSLLLITACNPQRTPLATLRPGQTSTPRPPLTPTRVVTATTPASPTPPPRLLTICYGQEPASLFPYDASASSARGILEAIYDGPFDIRGYDYRPVILTKEPSLADGDVAIEPVKVSNGDVMADSNGNLAYLGEGVSYRPSGCEDLACALTYTGTQTVTVTMDQMVVRFKLLPGIRWSDGASLTADDSVYSFEVAKSLFSSALPGRIARTRSYRSLDQYTVEWRGKWRQR